MTGVWLLFVVAAALAIAVIVLNRAGGVSFGWLFWRWGLAAAILCHFAGDIVIQTFGPRFLS